MFLADDIVLFPFKSILSVFQEIYHAAVQDIASEADGIRNELSQLYLALEAGNVSEDTFDNRERELLDRLDIIEERGLVGDDEDAEDEESEEEEEFEENQEDAEIEPVVILNRRTSP